MVRHIADLFSDRAKLMKGSDIRELLKLTQQKDMISFAGGLPNPQAFPVVEIQEICNDILSKNAYYALQYGATEGNQKLRELLIKRHVEKDGMKAEGNAILITSGSQQGLDLMGRVFLNKDDVVLVEAPSFTGAIGAFRTYRPTIEGIWMDENGMRMDVLRETIKHVRNHGGNIKFLYTIPTFHNPAGTSMSLARRKELLEIAHEHDIIIIEDDPYGELRFTDETFPTLKSMDKDNRVVYLGTFSKTLVPGFRCAWAFGPEEIINKMAIAKQSADLCTNTFTQAVAYEYMFRGYIDKHLNNIRALYKQKAEVMINAMKKYFPEEAKYNVPKGGMFVWVRLPKDINVRDMVPRAIQEKIAYVPGDAFYTTGEGKNCMRLNYTNASDEQIEEGIKRLGKIMKEELAKTKTANHTAPPPASV
ncbi:MAG: PLP-dependent aminotransferase family protein [Candidatus Thermoplasmatota archaeon]|nr:PLP-dependent aminotransferase family protein [Candidatus Thermoplasmatota archaeon]